MCEKACLFQKKLKIFMDGCCVINQKKREVCITANYYLIKQVFIYFNIATSLKSWLYFTSVLIFKFKNFKEEEEKSNVEFACNKTIFSISQ